MKIYTSYFAALKKIPEDMVPIAICAKPPDFFKGPNYKILAPSYSILMDYKKDNDKEKYIKRYNEEILGHLKPEDIIKNLGILSRGKDIVLLCYEKPNDFCHRHLVSKWLGDIQEVTELVF